MGDGGRLPLETWFWEMPTCTRWWTTATVLTSAMVQCQVVTPFQLFYSFRAVFVKSQVGPWPRSSTYSRIWKIDRWYVASVLAAYNYIPLLRTFLPRPSLPRILPPTLCQTFRGVIGTFTSPLLMAFSLCDDKPPATIPPCFNAFLGAPSFIDARLYMVPPQSGHEAELPGSAGFHSAISSMGPHGLQFGPSWLHS